MKKFLLLALTLFLIFGAFGCSQNVPEETPTSTPTPSPTSTPVVAPSPTPTPTPVPTSLTTGLPSDKEYKPIAVMIENSTGARPQTNLQAADIVYECMVEGSITRFMCIYNDNIPDVVGPVRSTRLYYIRLQQEWDSPLVHYGGPSDADRPSYVYGKAASHIKLRIDGIKGASSKYFWRDKSRKAPHNAYTDLEKVLEAYDYTPEMRDPFQFSSDISYTGQMVDTIYLPFESGKDSFVTYTYNSATDKFERAMDGKEFIDAATDKPVEVQNIIVQYADTYVLDNDVKGRKMVDVKGEGSAEFFIGGRHLTGTWEKTAYEEATKFYLEDGQELTLKPGNTWIHLHPDDEEIRVEYRES